MDALIEKIKKKGYWKVIIRPSKFKEKRIATREECSEIIKSSRLTLRGWDYPHINNAEGIFFSGKDSIASYCDWEGGGHYEYWQFYQHGQFIHYFAMKEDYTLPEEKIKEIKDSFPIQKPQDFNNRFLSILNTLYSVTEIFLFATNLAKRIDVGTSIVIEITLGNVFGRTLFFWDTFGRHLFKPYACLFRNENIVKELVIKKSELVSNSIELALDTAIDIFKDFNWSANKNIFLEDQKRFLERRM